MKRAGIVRKSSTCWERFISPHKALRHLAHENKHVISSVQKLPECTFWNSCTLTLLWMYELGCNVPRAEPHPFNLHVSAGPLFFLYSVSFALFPPHSIVFLFLFFCEKKNFTCEVPVSLHFLSFSTALSLALWLSSSIKCDYLFIYFSASSSSLWAVTVLSQVSFCQKCLCFF